MESNDCINAYEIIPGDAIRKDIICNDTASASFLNRAVKAGNQSDVSVYSHLNSTVQSNVSKFIIVICYKCYTYIKLQFA